MLAPVDPALPLVPLALPVPPAPPVEVPAVFSELGSFVSSPELLPEQPESSPTRIIDQLGNGARAIFMKRQPALELRFTLGKVLPESVIEGVTDSQFQLLQDFNRGNPILRVVPQGINPRFPSCTGRDGYLAQRSFELVECGCRKDAGSPWQSQSYESVKRAILGLRPGSLVEAAFSW